nr:MAG TPA: hypothetical protein [Caudoviricetes sp.]
MDPCRRNLLRGSYSHLVLFSFLLLDSVFFQLIDYGFSYKIVV